jgi:hypothetical protein
MREPWLGREAEDWDSQRNVQMNRYQHLRCKVTSSDDDHFHYGQATLYPASQAYEGDYKVVPAENSLRVRGAPPASGLKVVPGLYNLNLNLNLKHKHPIVGSSHHIRVGSARSR